MIINQAQYNPISRTDKKTVKQKSTLKNSFPSSNEVNYPAYYKDFLIDNKKLLSFGKSFSIPREVENEQDFIKGLKALNKYSSDDLNSILEFIREIIDSDSWEETEENVLFEMFTSLALSDKNSSMKVLLNIKNDITELENEDDYVDVNEYCKGVSAICANADYNDYRFSAVINHIIGLGDKHTDEFFRLIRDNLQNVNSDKFCKMLDNICRKYSKSGLDEINNIIAKLVDKYGYKNEDLVNGILMAVNENVPVDDISAKLEKRRVVNDVFDALNLEFMHEKNIFENVFTKPIEELINRGYTPIEIADMLSHNNYIYKLMEIENISKANEILLADFIEDIPNINYNTDIVSQYTKGSSIFNELLSAYQGDISKFPLNQTYETQSGVKYSATDAKNAIFELENVLEKQALKRDMTVYRGEGFGILNQKTTPDGIPMGKALKQAIENKDENEIRKIISQLNTSTLTQHRFMSTSYDKSGAYNFIKGENGIIWEINAPKGAHAIYCDPFNIDNGVEKEILFNKGCLLKINNAEYKDGKLFLQADLL